MIGFFNLDQTASQLTDRRATDLRRHACTSVADALAAVYARSKALESTEARALGLVAAFGSQIAKAAILCFDQQLWYGGAASVRQLIEVEYLLSAFERDAAEMERWLNASESALARRWKPRKARDDIDGFFNNKDYLLHWTHGGHPNPNVLPALLTAQPDDAQNVLWVDLAQHLLRVWFSLVCTIEAVDQLADLCPPADREAVGAALSEWIEGDELALLGTSN